MPNYNKRNVARQGETGHEFRTPLIDSTGTVLNFSQIVIANWTINFYVTTIADPSVLIMSGPMVEHPNTVKYPNQVVYIATQADMENEPGDYYWMIETIDPTGVIETYPKDTAGNTSYGLFQMLPSLKF